jgi:uncharacterized protein (TIGR02996 family)
MRTFEFSEGNSSKFWSIDLKGTQIEVTFGRIGTKGQTQVKEFPDSGKAQVAHDKLIQEKLGKGYVEKGPASAPAPTQLALEQAIVEEPDDLAAHSAFADYLTEQGDPRGEFAAAQLALEDPACTGARRKQLVSREKELLKRHGREWLGELTLYLLDQRGADDDSPKRYRHQFVLGWLDSLEIALLTVEFSRVLARAPQSRLLRCLVIQKSQYNDDEENPYEPEKDVPETAYWPGLYPLHRSPYLGNVRVCQLGERTEEPPDSYSSWSDAGFDGGLGLLEKMPRLEELYLRAHVAGTPCEKLFALKNFDHLRVLELYHKEAKHHLDVLARTRCLGRLTHLLFHPHGGGPYITLADVRVLVRSPYLGSLTHLQIRLIDMGDEGCSEFIASGILKRLRVLDLQFGCITDEGARILADCPDLSNLESLNVSGNWLTPAGIKVLKAIGVNLQARDQREEGDEQYLYEGDWE